MKKMLKKTPTALYYMRDGKRISGVHYGITGCEDGLTGCVSPGLTGCATGITGCVDDCDLTLADRNREVKIVDLTG